jgi:hypothetical protein
MKHTKCKCAAVLAGIALVIGFVFLGCNTGNGPETTPTTYTVNIGSLTNGSITANPTSGTEGTEITLTVTPVSSSYKLKAGTLKYGTTLINETTKKFNLPASDVTVTAEFEATSTGGNPGNGAGLTVTGIPSEHNDKYLYCIGGDDENNPSFAIVGCVNLDDTQTLTGVQIVNGTAVLPLFKGQPGSPLTPSNYTPYTDSDTVIVYLTISSASSISGSGGPQGTYWLLMANVNVSMTSGAGSVNTNSYSWEQRQNN